jgi:hypothetical protein
LLRLQPICSL